jgi:hypothetical protein
MWTWISSITISRYISWGLGVDGGFALQNALSCEKDEK